MKSLFAFASLYGMFALALCGCSPNGDRIPPPAGSEVSRGLKASGFEPGWTLDIADGRLTLVTDYGEKRFTAALPEPVQEGEVTRYRLDDKAVTIEIAEQVCRDNARGVPYPVTVTVKMPSQTLRGCGGEPSETPSGTPR